MQPAAAALARGAAGIVLAALLFWLPGLGWAGLALAAGAAALPVAAALATHSAVARGAGLRLVGRSLGRLLGRPWLRLAVAALAGLSGGVLLVAALGRGMPGAGAHWLVTATVAGAFALVWSASADWAASQEEPPFDRHIRRRVSVLAATGAGLLASLLAALFAPLPDLPPSAAGAAGPGLLASEIAGIAALHAGWQAQLRGVAEGLTGGAQAGAFALLLLSGGLASGALALLCAGLTLRRDELARALAPASAAAAPEAPALPVRTLAASLSALTLAATLPAGLATARLAATAPEARPAALLAIPAERMGEVLLAAGTSERLAGLEAEARAETRAALEAALHAGFDAMEAGVDPFLDWYYTLPAEYARMAALLLGRFEAVLQRQLRGALEAGDPFAEAAALLASAESADEALAARLAEDRLALIEEARLGPVNPARLRVAPAQAAPADLPRPMAEMRMTLQMRGLTAIGAGALTGLVAGRVVARASARGVTGRAAAIAVRIVGPRAAIAAGGGMTGGLLGSLAGPGGTAAGAGAGAAIALGTTVAVDALLLRLEERLSREGFRAELLEMIAEQRAEALAALDAP